MPFHGKQRHSDSAAAVQQRASTPLQVWSPDPLQTPQHEATIGLAQSGESFCANGIPSGYELFAQLSLSCSAARNMRGEPPCRHWLAFLSIPATTVRRVFPRGSHL